MNQASRFLRDRIVRDVKDQMIVAAARTAKGMNDSSNPIGFLREAIGCAEWRADEVADGLLRHYTIRERVRK